MRTQACDENISKYKKRLQRQKSGQDEGKKLPKPKSKQRKPVEGAPAAAKPKKKLELPRQKLEDELD